MEIRDAFDAGGIDAATATSAAAETTAATHGRGGDVGGENRGPAIGIEAAGKSGDGCRTVIAVLDIVLARPGHLDRDLDGLGDLNRFLCVVGAGPASESAAEVLGVDRDLVGAQTREAKRDAGDASLHLGGSPHVASIRADMGNAVERLHRGVGEERRFVNGFDLLRGRGQRGGAIALSAGGCGGQQRLFRECLSDAG
jgi:hypothetical protein